MRFILRMIVAGFGIWIATALLPGIGYTSDGALIWAAVALSLINAIVRPLIVVVTIPITIVTLGIFLLVINALMLNLAAWFVDGFYVDGFLTSILGALVISIVGAVFSGLVDDKKKLAND